MPRLLKLTFAASLVSSFAVAAAQSPKLQRQLSYIDLGVQAAGQFTHSVSGPITVLANDTGATIDQSTSRTLGALGTLRYSPKPYLGVEINGGYARYTETYNVPPFQIQTQANEFTFGYLVVPPYTIYGLKPYASAGVGVVRFAPTAGGGQGTLSQGRLGYYYNLGVQKDVFGGPFGVRVGFRQLFFLAPDFQQNYLQINKRTSTAEPVIGFYLHF